MHGLFLFKMRKCKICGKELREEEEYICDECLSSDDLEHSAVQEIVTYVHMYLPLPAHQSDLADVGMYEKYITRIYSRAIIFKVLDEIMENQFDDPSDIVMDLMIELYSFAKVADSEEEMFRLDVSSATLSDLRHYLLSLGYGSPGVTRY
jgi:RecJ-like exonuclease